MVFVKWWKAEITNVKVVNGGDEVLCKDGSCLLHEARGEVNQGGVAGRLAF